MNKDEFDPENVESAESTPFAGNAASEIENLRAEKNALFEKLARAQADFQNSRKRLESEQKSQVQFALSKLIESQLPLIDNLERAIGVDPSTTDTANVLKGVQVVHDQWRDLLKGLGVVAINPKPGEAFDPTFHQAIMQEPSDYPEGTISRGAQTGYSLNGKLVRSALVVVSKGRNGGGA